MKGGVGIEVGRLGGGTVGGIFEIGIDVAIFGTAADIVDDVSVDVK